MSRTLRLLVTALLVAALPLSAAGQGSEPVSTQLMAQLEKTAGTTTTIASDFVQEKHLAIFKSVMTSRGRFYYRKPDQLRWELTSPVASGFVLKGDRGRRWNERSGQKETFRISQEPVMKIVSEQLFAWTKADFTWLKGQYRITVIDESPIVLRLEPLAAATAGFLHHLIVSFSADSRSMKSVELHEKDGDFTRIRFQNTVVNKPLAADIF